MTDGEDRTRRKRITSNYVIKTDLMEETGIAEVDDALYCLVNLLNLGAGASLRAILLIGSYASGTSTPESDIDVCLVLKDGGGEQARRLVASFVAHMSQFIRWKIDPMYNGAEAPLYDPAKTTDESGNICGPVLKLAIKRHSLLLWGEDIRSRVAPGGEQAMRGDVIAPPLNWIKQIHYGSADAAIAPPLVHPAPGTPDLGYGNLDHVAVFVLHMARALVYLRSGRFLFDKRQVAAEFAESVGGPWVGLVRQVAAARYGETSASEKEAAHRRACQELPAFENDFLEGVAPLCATAAGGATA